jgi:hypothetical protein
MLPRAPNIYIYIYDALEFKTHPIFVCVLGEKYKRCTFLEFRTHLNFSTWKMCVLYSSNTVFIVFCFNTTLFPAFLSQTTRFVIHVQSSSVALQPLGGSWPPFQFLNLFIVVRTPWTKDQPVARPQPTHRTIQTQNKRIQTSMSQVGFEPIIPVFERAKTVHALDCAATVIGYVPSSGPFYG